MGTTVGNILCDRANEVSMFLQNGVLFMDVMNQSPQNVRMIRPSDGVGVCIIADV